MSTAIDLTRKRCVSCESGVSALPPKQIQNLLSAIPAWKLSSDGKRIRREWRVSDFLTAVDLFQRIAVIAEGENHHPDLHLEGYRNVMVEIRAGSLEGAPAHRAWDAAGHCLLE